MADENRPDIACVILAGGASRRFGSPKGLALLEGVPLVDHVSNALKSQVNGPVILNAPEAGPYGVAGYTCIADRLTGEIGPLAGIHAALLWAQDEGYAFVLTAPVDTPFLPVDLVGRLRDTGAPAVAQSLGRIHGVCGLWPTTATGSLEAYIGSGQRKVEAWVLSIGATPVNFAAQGGKDPFFNINTRGDGDFAGVGSDGSA
ncbi:MAG: molybdenum cofactor guanylyltransferase [Hyphomonas sp.]